MANSELSNCNLLPIEYIDPRFISVAITRELDPACNFQLAAVQGQAVSAEGAFPGVVLCVQRGWRLQKESVTCLFINISPLGVSVKPAQAV